MMPAGSPDYVDVTVTDETHNASPQKHVIANDDPALDKAHEHHHAHLHHDLNAEKGRNDEVVYSKGTTFESSTVPHQDPQDHDIHRRKHAEVAAGGLPAFGDPEKNGLSPIRSEEDPQTHTFSNLYRRYRLFFHLFIWLLFTGWWIAGLILHGVHDPLSSRTGWLKPFLFWLAITLRILFFHVPITIVTRPMHWIWSNTGVRVAELCPERLKTPLGAFVVIAVFLIGAFASPESQDNTRDVPAPVHSVGRISADIPQNRAISLFGLLVIIAVMWATSRNRKVIEPLNR